MTTKRRDFIRQTLIGSGLIISGLAKADSSFSTIQNNSGQVLPIFNMCNYAAPKINNVRIGFIGIGMRGAEAVKRISYIEGATITALCDLYDDRVNKSIEELRVSGINGTQGFSGSKHAWKKLCEREDIDLIYICTPWEWHTPMAVYAMEQGKHVAVEVPAAKTVEECWQLVETSEKTRKHCMMLENCCYDFFELLTLNMARQGYFGEIVHAEGAYIHDLYDYMYSKDMYAEMWRLKENTRNGSLYSTHGLGPICQIMNINRGDQLDFLTSISTNDFQMGKIIDELAAKDSFYDEFKGKNYRGNMNTTIIRTHLGRTLMVQHDVTSPRPYSRIHLISGTKGMASKWPYPARIAKGHSWLNEKEFKDVEKEYTPEIVKFIGEMAKKVGGHGGMDFIMDWRLIDCLRNGLPLDQDVYDAALWSAISPLSEDSVANRGRSVDVPDFTRGAWKNNIAVDISLRQGGNTQTRTF